MCACISTYVCLYRANGIFPPLHLHVHTACNASAGLGYVDSGREVFDEDYESDEEEGMEERGEKEPNSKKRKKGKMGKSSIKDMLLRTKPKNEVCCMC